MASCFQPALEADKGSATKLETIKAYKFTLALENAIAEDYVTEKVYDPLIASSVPVYLGAPNIDDFAPRRPSHHVADWEVRPTSRYLLEVAGATRPMHASSNGRQSPFAPRFPRCSIGSRNMLLSGYARRWRSG